MDNLISIFFPTAPAKPSGTSASGNTGSALPKQFSPEFFELLQGEISALTAPGHGSITTADINKLSDTQIEILGNFLSNVEVGENGEMIYSHPDIGSFVEPQNILPSASLSGSVKAEFDPAVIDVIEQIPAPDVNTITTTASEKLSAHMEQLLNGLPQESRNAFIDGEVSAELIATGMSPAEMVSFIQNLKAKTERDKEDAQNTLLSLIAPAAAETKPVLDEQNVIFLPRGIVVSATASSKSEGKSSDTDKGINVAGEANAGSKAGENVARALNKAIQSLTTQGSMTGLYDGTATATDVAQSERGFDKILSMFEQPATERSGSIKMPEGLDRNLNAPLTLAEAKALADVKISAGLSTVPANAAATEQNVSASALLNSVFPDGVDWSTAPGAPQTANNNVTLATMTSLSSQSNAATAAHPATQTVAATITKAGQGDNKNITLRLDPPALGRVQVRMEITEDHMVKAIITSEKPQTHMMLQRDAHVLERALQDAGLDALSSSLEFELSQDGGLFSDNDGRGGDNASGGSSGSSNGGDNDGMEIIESKMTWNVDPETGHMHYNLMV